MLHVVALLYLVQLIVTSTTPLFNLFPFGFIVILYVALNIAYTVLFPFNVILLCALVALLLVFHHTNVHPFFVAEYDDNVILAPLNLYCVVAVVLHPFVVALNANEFTATVHVSHHHQFHNASFALTLHVYTVHAVKSLVAVQLVLVGVPLWAALLQLLLLHICTSYHATLLHPLSFGAVHFNVGLKLLFSCNVKLVGLFGQLLSTCTVALGHVATFPLLLVSFTASAFNVNHVVPFTLATHVYVNVYVLLVEVPATVLLFHNVSQLLLYCTLLALTLV